MAKLFELGFSGAALGAALLGASPAMAQGDTGWKAGDITVSAGLGGVLFSESGTVSVLGSPVAGSNISLSDGMTMALEAQYFFKPQLSLALMAGIPPKTDVGGQGSLAGLGRLGTVRYGLGGVVARYHFAPHQRISPYLGLGVAHFFSVASHDASVQNLEVAAATHVLVQAGVDVHLTRHIGLYANAAYTPLTTHAEGKVIGFPAAAAITLHPTVLQTGVSYRF